MVEFVYVKNSSKTFRLGQIKASKGILIMEKESVGIIVGGICPALLFGISGVLQKFSNRAGISTGLYLICIGVAVTVVGIGLHVIIPNRSISFQSGGYAILIGLFWASAMGLIGIALTRYDVAISILVPLYNMNTLVAVVLGLILLSEWQSIDVPRLLVGACLIVFGGLLAASS